VPLGRVWAPWHLFLRLRGPARAAKAARVAILGCSAARECARRHAIGEPIAPHWRTKLGPVGTWGWWEPKLVPLGRGRAPWPLFLRLHGTAPPTPLTAIFSARRRARCQGRAIGAGFPRRELIAGHSWRSAGFNKTRKKKRWSTFSSSETPRSGASFCARRARPPPAFGTARATARRKTTETNVRPIYYGINVMALSQEHRTQNNITPPS